VNLTAFCSDCGKKLPEDANFCAVCGARTKKGEKAGVSTPEEEMKEAFAKMAQEMEKAFTAAAKEIQKAFKTAKENVRQSTEKGTLGCPSCGQQNPGDSTFCYKCGNKLG
jgi:predicted amidophosphoribosyltransferase